MENIERAYYPHKELQISVKIAADEVTEAMSQLDRVNKSISELEAVKDGLQSSIERTMGNWVIKWNPHH